MAVEDELEKVLQFRAGTADSDINAMVRTIPTELLRRAIAELRHLRSLAGAVTDGPSHAQLKRQQGPQQVTE